MGLKKLAEKVSEYQARLAEGKAAKIEARHVEKVLAKLRRKEADILSELSAGPGAVDRADLAQKLHLAREHIERAEWLLAELNGKKS